MVSRERGALKNVTLPSCGPIRKIRVTGGGAGSASATLALEAAGGGVGEEFERGAPVEPPEQATATDPARSSAAAGLSNIGQGV